MLPPPMTDEVGQVILCCYTCKQAWSAVHHPAEMPNDAIRKKVEANRQCPHCNGTIILYSPINRTR